MTWLRFERHLRHHALYARWGARVVTYCGRVVRDDQVLAWPEDGARPPQYCRSCLSLIRHPYLLRTGDLEARLLGTLANRATVTG